MRQPLPEAVRGGLPARDAGSEQPGQSGEHGNGAEVELAARHIRRAQSASNARATPSLRPCCNVRLRKACSRSAASMLRFLPLAGRQPRVVSAG